MKILKMAQEALMAVPGMIQDPECVNAIPMLAEALQGDDEQKVLERLRLLVTAKPELARHMPLTFSETADSGPASQTVIHTDGACSGNPGPGGWAVIIDGRDPIWGAEPSTTNNRMELSAMLRALQHCKSVSGTYLIRSDSEYVLKGMSEWMPNWKSRGWRTAANKNVVNEDIWKRIDAELAAAKTVSTISFQHVRGHSGDVGNELADVIAVAARKVAAVSDHPKEGVGDPSDPTNTNIRSA